MLLGGGGDSTAAEDSDEELEGINSSEDLIDGVWERHADDDSGKTYVPWQHDKFCCLHSLPRFNAVATDIGTIIMSRLKKLAGKDQMQA
jgi:hypothetical protein